MRLVFFNIGWMAHYKGIENDSIARGGEYNTHSIGHEVCNFFEIRQRLYGYVQPVGDYIRIEKLGASKHDEKIDDVTVVWTAGPESGGTAVVGWYRNATVYRRPQPIAHPDPVQRSNGITHYRVTAKASDSTLLPVGQRDILIPRAVKGGIGQSNVWFADKEESKHTVERVIARINGDVGAAPPDVDYDRSAQEGNPRLVAHLRRERDAGIVIAKKAAVLKVAGKLCCEVCGFDFQATYGELGKDFCEVHHLLPIAKSDGVTRTTLDDLAIVCSNCHRIIHRRDPMPAIDELSHYLRTRSR